MTHLDRDTLMRFYNSDLEDKEVERVLQHLTSCEECEHLAEEIWSSVEPAVPSSQMPSSAPSPIPLQRREEIRDAALRGLRFGQLVGEFITFFAHGLGRLVRVFLAPLEDALDDSSESDKRRKNR